LETNTMYDMYPDWGPARQADDHPTNQATWANPLQEAIDRRDNGGERPDDN